MEKETSKVKKVSVFVIQAVAFIGIGFIICSRFFPHATSVEIFGRQIRQDTLSTNTYAYIDPLVLCDVGGSKGAEDFKNIKQSIVDFIAAQSKIDSAERVSVYFDTRDGRSLTINPTQKYSPASLMKVPTMIALLKAAETDELLLDKKITYKKSLGLNSLEYFTPKEQLKVGQTYTVAELIKRMIVYSDNETLPLIVNTSIKNASAFVQAYKDIGLPVPQNTAETQQDIITVSTYANAFRVLYNATYLSRDFSEKAMSILAQTDFTSGIKAGISSSTIVVAQKFGERNYSSDVHDTTSKKELHDCGIIYYPKHPYMLCVMTEGTNFDQLDQVIRGISAITYQYIDTNLAKQK